MKKSDIETHSDGCGRRSHPALNVKVNKFGLYDYELAALKGCTERDAERALQFAFESAQQIFWEDAQRLAREVFGQHVKVYSEGRCGGWLVVHGLPELDSWDAVAVGKWSRLARLIAADIKWRCSRDNVLENIEANEWCKAGAELYNFVDKADGSHACIADLKAEAKAAGFAAVVRS